MTLAQRLDPAHLHVSPKFTAVLAYLVGEVWTDPAITGMAVTSDGFVMLATTDDPFFDEMLGSMDDLYRNLYGVSEAVGLTSNEYATLMAAASSKVAGWR